MRYPDLPSGTHTGPSFKPKPLAISSALAFGATSASSAGSRRVMLNGFDSGAGPSPRMPGGGEADAAEPDPAGGAAGCASALPAASASAQSTAGPSEIK